MSETPEQKKKREDDYYQKIKDESKRRRDREWEQTGSFYPFPIIVI